MAVVTFHLKDVVLAVVGAAFNDLQLELDEFLEQFDVSVEIEIEDADLDQIDITPTLEAWLRKEGFEDGPTE